MTTKSLPAQQELAARWGLPAQRGLAAQRGPAAQRGLVLLAGPLVQAVRAAAQELRAALPGPEALLGPTPARARTCSAATC